MRLPPTPSQPLIRQVVANDLCIACGACVPACPRANIRPVFHQGRGAEEVEIITAESCAGCPQPCDAVCPSLTIEFAKQREAFPGRAAAAVEPPARDGWMKSAFLGWSPLYRDDEVSSSGGVIRAFIAHALNTGTPVVCLARDPATNTFRPRLLTTPEQMRDIPGSIYHSTSFIGAIDLIRQAPAPVLLVAIPCQLSGILNFVVNQEKDLGGNIRLVCGIVCGWMYTHHSLRAFAHRKGIAQPEIGATTYRGGDRVGKLRIVKGNAASAFERRNFPTFRDAVDYRSSFSTDFNRLRCRLCEDHLNMGADVIAGDAWVERSAPRKASIIGCRTQRGQEALANLEQLGLLHLEPASFADFVESQSSNLVYGTHARRMNRILGERGGPVPRFHYGDAATPVAVGVRDRLALRFELWRRSLVRAGCYRIYRWHYVLRNPRMVARFCAKALGLLRRRGERG